MLFDCIPRNVACMSESGKPKKKPKRPRDPNQLAAEIVRLSTEDADEQEEATPDPVKEYLAKIGRKGGLKGGRARAEALSARKRKAIARNAAAARWDKKRKK